MAWAKRIDVMLCQPMDDKKLERIFKHGGCVCAQPKLDGERAWVHALSDEDYLISSQGKFINSVPHINLALKILLDKFGRPFQLDGELYNKRMSFEQISSIVSRTVNLHDDYKEMQYHIFDIKLDNEPQFYRFGLLKDMELWWRDNAPEWIKYAIQFVPFHTCASPEEVDIEYSRYIEEGYEGIIVRHPSANYITRNPAARPWFILKFKPKREDIYDFVDMEQQYSEAGIGKGMVGAVTCADTEGNKFRVGCGSGLDSGSLRDVWFRYTSGEYRSGCKVRVQYQSLTQTGGVPRFGKFIEVFCE